MKFLFVLIGLGCGFILAGGVIGLITKLKLITRFADVTHTASYLKVYGTALLFGSVGGNILFLFPIAINVPLSDIVFPLMTFVMGIFVGCLATSLAETLNVTAIFSRRLRLHTYLGAVIISAALGKFIGSMFFFEL